MNGAPPFWIVLTFANHYRHEKNFGKDVLAVNRFGRCLVQVVFLSRSGMCISAMEFAVGVGKELLQVRDDQDPL